MAKENIIEVKDISIEFPGVKALSNVDCTFKSGMVKALIGANGAGKSTLMKVLSGANPTYTGQIYYNGEPIEIRNPRDAKQHGIAIVHQEVDSMLIPNLSVAENIMINHIIYDLKGMGNINWKKIYKEAGEALEQLDIDINLKTLVSKLSLAEKQMVVIARSMVQECNFLILDEPTAPLSLKETERLFELVEKLKKQGCGVIFISHRLNELFQICEEVTVLKDGKLVGTRKIDSNLQIQDVVEMMLGKSFENHIDKSGREIGKVVLKTENLTEKFDRVHDINMEIKKGEIVGISGLVGAGKTELCKLLFGEYQATSGKYYLHDKKVKFKTPCDAISKGLALIPEERRKEGIFIGDSVGSNLSVVKLDNVAILKFFVSKRKEKQKAKEKIDDLLIKTPSEAQKVGLLSGGNQQKVTIGKWLDTEADIYIFDEPTKGIDVGAKQEIYKLIVQLARQGKSIIYTSCEMSEILMLSDRTYVMYDGTICADLDIDKTNEEEILFYATGGKK